MYKGVIRHIKSIRDIRINIMDIKGNKVSFPMCDIPDIIKQLQDAIDGDSIKEEIECVGPVPDLPDYSPIHNSLDAGYEDGVIAQKIYQNLVERTWQDRIAVAKSLKSGFHNCYFMDSAISQSSKHKDFLEDLDER